jgi:hypothetical protein
MNKDAKQKEEWELRTKTGILNRIMDNSIRLEGMAWRNASQWTQ